MVFFCSPLFARRREKKKTVTADVDKKNSMQRYKKKSNAIEKLRKEMKATARQRPEKTEKAKVSKGKKEGEKTAERGEGLNKNSSFNASPRKKRSRREARFDSAS
jgi:hypothetical protein